jgi:UDP-3-O-[3-hydroxymyristoyl] glucosamine N-acyltransferase
MSAARGLALAEVAALVGGELVRGDASTRVLRVMPTDRAEPDALTFVTRPEYLAALGSCRAAAVMLSPELLARDDLAVPEGLAILRVRRPYVAYARAAQALAPPEPRPEGVHPLSAIDPTAILGAGVSIGPFAVVGARARIGARAVLHAGAHVGPDASIGEDTVLHDHAVVRHGCRVGARCVLHAGVVIGADGFGFAPDVAGGLPVHVKIPQVGDVVIEDDVELGANSCVDRGALGTTRVGAGTKIDNLVQLGHNVEVGPACIVVAQAGVAGSSRLGAAVTVGAQAGVSGHLSVGEGSVIHGQAGVMKDLAPRSQVMGSPSSPKAAFFRGVVLQGKLDSLFQRVKNLERLLGAASPSAPPADPP